MMNICKSPGMSSFEVVSRVRRLSDTRRIGHTGTLDPSACGVLVLCLGKATRLVNYLEGGAKSYRAEILLGVETDSQDMEGAVTAMRDAGHLTESTVRDVLPRFTGTISQLPPLRSAIQVDGLRAYDYARRGKPLDLPAREVTIHAIDFVRLQPGERARLLLDITCARGTYIRSLARDIGEELGTGGMLSFLARTFSSGCSLEDSVTLDELYIAADEGRLGEYVMTPDSGLGEIPALHISDATTMYAFGTEIPFEGENGLYRVYGADQFYGLGDLNDGKLRPRVHLI